MHTPRTRLKFIRVHPTEQSMAFLGQERILLCKPHVGIFCPTPRTQTLRRTFVPFLSIMAFFSILLANDGPGNHQNISGRKPTTQKRGLFRLERL